MIFDKIATLASKSGDTLKGLAKTILLSHRCTISKKERQRPLIILGNGPSLNELLKNDIDRLKDFDLMAVNFAANTQMFTMLRPKYYILVDPHFFNPLQDNNVASLIDNLTKVDWPMTLFVPASAKIDNRLTDNVMLNIERFNPIGAEGFSTVIYPLYDTGRAMPRPRNVLIAAIMTGIQAGYKTIFLTGADHSWTKTISVEENNMVVSVQPHFYEDDKTEKDRVTSVYQGVRLHEIMYSFHVAFKAYHIIASYADSRCVRIYNATPGSFIDAFPRRHI